MKVKIFIISFLFFSNLYSQNIKKIFKEIKNNEIELAIIESAKTDSREKFDEEEKILFQLGKCLLMSNEQSSLFKPYDGYNLYKSITITKKEDIDDFLSKYKLSLNKISDLIFKGILIDSKKINTVSSYESALNICKPCNYESELIELKTDAAYVAAKTFLTLKSMNNFILNYPKSKYIIVASDTRDSIALSKTNKEYISLLTFTKQYPNSKLTPKVIQELPDVLYKEAIEINTVESLKRFLGIFPKDIRSKEIEEKLSKIKYSEISVNKINNWKVDSLLNEYQNYDCNYFIELPILQSKTKLSMVDYNKVEVEVELYFKLFKVQFNGKWGAIDKFGKVIIPIKYDEVIHQLYRGFAAVQNDKWGAIDEFGNEITPLIYDRINFLHEGLVAVQLNDKWGIIDFAGKEIIPLKYDRIDFFHEGFAAVELNNKRGFVDVTGTEVIPLIYDRIDFFHEGFAAVRLNNKWGFIDVTGKEVVAINYDRIDFFHEGLAAVLKKGKCGFVDTNGIEIIPLKYDGSGRFHEGFAAVSTNDKWGFVDTNGIEIIPLKYDVIRRFNEGFAAVSTNDKWGFIDATGKEVIPLIYDKVIDFNDGIALVLLENNEICIDKTGKEIIHFKNYKFISQFYNGLAAVEYQKSYGYGLIDKYGKEIIPIKYDEVNHFSEGLAAVLKKGKWGFVDTNGIEIIPLKYDKVTNFKNGTALAIENCEIKILNLYNHELNKNEIYKTEPKTISNEN